MVGTCYIASHLIEIILFMLIEKKKFNYGRNFHQFHLLVSKVKQSNKIINYQPNGYLDALVNSKRQVNGSGRIRTDPFYEVGWIRLWLAP